MARRTVLRIAALWLAACSAEPAHDIDQQPVMTQQGTELHGLLPHGSQLQGKTIEGFRFAGATLNGSPLVNLRIDKGELIAEHNQVTLRGTALVNARVFAEAKNRTVQPPRTIVVEYQITDIVAEDSIYDPLQTGNTFLYTLAHNVDNTGSWQPACPVDSDGRRAAIPLADTWDTMGTRINSAQLFTFGCTTAAIAKCYRLGYRPWVPGYGNLTITHWTCTRVLRADYCGDGVSHTLNGTLINVWDNLPSPGPILTQGSSGMTFEAAWNQNGALCLSHARWDLDGAVVAAACPNRLRPPGQSMRPGTVCDNVAQALMQGGTPPRLFNESPILPGVP